MTRITVSIQARLGSSRLPGKVLFHLGDRRILDWVVHRCRNADVDAEVVVAIGDRPENEAIVELCERADYRYSVGSEDDLLARHRSVAVETGCDVLIRVTADCPFLPPVEVERLIALHRDGGGYTTNADEEMPIGAAADVIDVELLDGLAAAGGTHPVKRLRAQPERWGTTVSPSEKWLDLGEAHTAVDTPADYWRLVDAVDAVGSDPYDVTEWVATRTA